MLPVVQRHGAAQPVSRMPVPEQGIGEHVLTVSGQGETGQKFPVFTAVPCFDKSAQGIKDALPDDEIGVAEDVFQHARGQIRPHGGVPVQGGRVFPGGIRRKSPKVAGQGVAAAVGHAPRHGVQHMGQGDVVGIIKYKIVSARMAHAKIARRSQSFVLFPEKSEPGVAGRLKLFKNLLRAAICAPVIGDDDFKIIICLAGQRPHGGVQVFAVIVMGHADGNQRWAFDGHYRGSRRGQRRHVVPAGTGALRGIGDAVRSGRESLRGDPLQTGGQTARIRRETLRRGEYFRNASHGGGDDGHTAADAFHHGVGKIVHQGRNDDQRLALAQQGLGCEGVQGVVHFVGHPEGFHSCGDTGGGGLAAAQTGFADKQDFTNFFPRGRRQFLQGRAEQEKPFASFQAPEKGHRRPVRQIRRAIQVRHITNVGNNTAVFRRFPASLPQPFQHIARRGNQCVAVLHAIAFAPHYAGTFGAVGVPAFHALQYPFGGGVGSDGQTGCGEGPQGPLGLDAVKPVRPPILKMDLGIGTVAQGFPDFEGYLQIPVHAHRIGQIRKLLEKAQGNAAFRVPFPPAPRLRVADRDGQQEIDGVPPLRQMPGQKIAVRADAAVFHRPDGVRGDDAMRHGMSPYAAGLRFSAWPYRI